MGVITVLREDAQRFGEEEEAFLITLSAQLAGIIVLAQTSYLLTDTDKSTTQEERVLNGVPSSPGVAFGKAALVYPLADLDAVPEFRVVEDTSKEIARFKAALNQTKEDIKRLSLGLSSLPVEEQALFEAYVRILESPDLESAVIDKISIGNWAQGALKQIIAAHVAQFEAIDDAYLRERAADIRDLGRRILTHLQANTRVAPSYPKNTILVGDEITPATLAEMPDGHLVGLVSKRGTERNL